MFAFSVLDIYEFTFMDHYFHFYLGALFEAVLLSFVMSLKLRSLRAGYETANNTLFDIYEEQLKESDDLLRLSKEKAQAIDEKVNKVKHLASASHDIHQHLLVMRMNLETLKEQGASSSAVENFEQAIQYVENITHDILTVSKEEAVPQNQINMRELFKGIHSNLQPVADKKGLKLRCIAHDFQLMQSEVLIKRIMENLIRNALHSTHQGGVLFTFRYTSEGFVLQVYDTGVGMTHAQIEHFSKAFNRAGEQQYEGFGLGLYIVSKLCNQAGFEVRVNSVIGKGTRFTVLIPF